MENVQTNKSRPIYGIDFDSQIGEICVKVTKNNLGSFKRIGYMENEIFYPIETEGTYVDNDNVNYVVERIKDRFLILLTNSSRKKGLERYLFEL